MEPNEGFAVLVESQHDIHENIKFADQKTAGVIGINSLLLGLVFKLATETTSCSGRGHGLFICLVVLSVGIGLGIWVIRPRGGRSYHRKAGLVDPNCVFINMTGQKGITRNGGLLQVKK